MSTFARFRDFRWKDRAWFTTSKKRPRKLPLLHERAVPCTFSDVALVLQGPVHTRDSLTYETVRWYRAWNPAATVIVSTWDDEDLQALKELESLGALVITSKKPTNPGPANSNLQMTTSNAGLVVARDLGLKYSLKSRADQRLCSPTFVSMFLASLEAFPLDSSVTNQRQRLIGLSLNTFLFRMYGLSDMTLFGETADVLNYWDGALDPRQDEEIAARNHREFARRRVAEVFFCANFLERMGHELEWTLRDSWEALKSRFLILDSSMADVFWPKYTFAEDRWASYDGNPRFQEMTFSIWLQIKVSRLVPDESVLDWDW